MLNKTCSWAKSLNETIWNSTRPMSLSSRQTWLPKCPSPACWSNRYVGQRMEACLWQIPGSWWRTCQLPQVQPLGLYQCRFHRLCQWWWGLESIRVSLEKTDVMSDNELFVRTNATDPKLLTPAFVNYLNGKSSDANSKSSKLQSFLVCRRSGSKIQSLTQLHLSELLETDALMDRPLWLRFRNNALLLTNNSPIDLILTRLMTTIRPFAISLHWTIQMMRMIPNGLLPLNGWALCRQILLRFLIRISTIMDPQTWKTFTPKIPIPITVLTYTMAESLLPDLFFLVKLSIDTLFITKNLKLDLLPIVTPLFIQSRR